MRRHPLLIVRIALLALTTALTLSTSSKATPIPAGDSINLQFTASAAGNIITFVNPGTSFAATGSLTPLDCTNCVTITSPLDISQTNPTLDITLAAAPRPAPLPQPDHFSRPQAGRSSLSQIPASLTCPGLIRQTPH